MDGTASFDEDGDYPLFFAWTVLSAPTGSSAVLVDADQALSLIYPDVPGECVIELIVTDTQGVSSIPDTVRVDTANLSPVAEAGPDQTVLKLGARILLSGLGSYDPDGDSLAYDWRFISVPEHSTAFLETAKTAAPSFTADTQGDYVVELSVVDDWGAAAVDTLLVSFENVAPVACTSGDQIALAGTTTYVSGACSTDLNLDLLSYKLSLVSAPTGSNAQLYPTDGVSTSLVTDLPGEYVVELTVNDGAVSGAPAQALLTVALAMDALLSSIDVLMSLISELPDQVHRSPSLREPLTHKVTAVASMVRQERYQDARQKLLMDVREKMNGFADLGHLDPTDWVIVPDIQQQLDSHIAHIIELLEHLLQD